MKQFEFADQICRLSGSIGVEVAAGAHRERHAAHVTDDWTNPPSAEDVAGHSGLQQRLVFPKREHEESPQLEVVRTVKAGRRAVLRPIRRVRKTQGVEIFIVFVVDSPSTTYKPARSSLPCVNRRLKFNCIEL